MEHGDPYLQDATIRVYADPGPEAIASDEDLNELWGSSNHISQVLRGRPERARKYDGKYPTHVTYEIEVPAGKMVPRKSLFLVVRRDAAGRTEGFESFTLEFPEMRDNAAAWAQLGDTAMPLMYLVRIKNAGTGASGDTAQYVLHRILLLIKRR
jgi:hypothetical protein